MHGLAVALRYGSDFKRKRKERPLWASTGRTSFLPKRSLVRIFHGGREKCGLVSS
jgi:hypothetical protein